MALKKLLFLSVFAIAITFSSCAKKGRPSGGPKDETPPLFVIANPPYKTINFKEKQIKIEFNEYIKLKDVNSQLIISPPQKNRPLISPQGGASKYITIKIIDTLLPNTTYTFDFGNSVEDNNEGNKLENFKYVFSTGNYIDSLNLKGSVKNSYASDKVENIKMLLYKADTSYRDSTVYKRKPDYVTSTLDSSSYRFSNLKEGKYFLFALKDAAGDYLFDPRRDQLGFLKDTIVLPRDSIILKQIALFKQEIPYSFKRASELRKGQLIFGYEGLAKDLKIDVLSDVPTNFKTISFFEKDKDSLNLWHSPIEKDSLVFKVTNGSVIDTTVVKLRKKELDSLVVTPVTRGYLEFKDTLLFSPNNPITKIDTTKIVFIDKDTLKVPYTPFISKTENKVGILFDKKYDGNYNITIEPKALTDIFNQVNDTIKLRFKTKKPEDYGDITYSIQNPKNKSLIIELIDENNNLEGKALVNSSTLVSFKFLKAKKYTVRVIYDDNNNGKWDTGNYFNRSQPEKVEYFHKDYEVRLNFSYNEIITIKD